jgi:hypothetical protein
VAGLSFYSGGPYPPDFDGALFFTDYSRDCIWVMKTNGGSLPSTSAITTFAAGAANPVDLQIGPSGELYYADFDGGTIRRIEYTPAGAAHAGNQAPTPTITSPATGTTWQVGDTIAFTGSATDPEQGALAPSALSWSLVLQHCPSNCHTHPLESWPGVAGGSFSTPDHEYPSHLELRLTATDDQGLASTTTLRLDPRTVDVTLGSDPAGRTLTLDGTSAVAPFTTTVIMGSTHSISAPSPQTTGPQTWTFTGWSDGDAQTHNITAGATGTRTAAFSCSAGPLACPLAGAR